ncbi:unnamed protein product [Discula destructiva]
MDAGNFTEDEKRFVLAEYIKASQVDTEQLVAFIKQCRLEPDWFMMQLPGGRNMHQCMRAASSMLETDLSVPSVPTVPNLRKRKSGDFLGDPAHKRLASMPHTVYQQPSLPQAPTPPLPQPSPLVSQQVHIQPRPPAPVLASDVKQSTPEGYGVFQSKAPANGYGVFQSNPTGKKRGRPSKAEKEAQARANVGSVAASGPVPISPKPAVQSTQSQGAPTPPLPAPGPPYTSYAAATSTTVAEARDSKGGSTGGQKLPPLGPYRQYPERAAIAVKSEKSPSIGNLLTSGPPAEPQQKGDTAQAR